MGNGSVLPEGSDYAALRRAFRWDLPPDLNLVHSCIGETAWRRPGQSAIIHVSPGGGEEHWTYQDLDKHSARLANALAAGGFNRGDRLAILLPQSPHTALAHLAAWRLGGITVPLAMQFGGSALTYRLADSGAAALITNAAGMAKVESMDTRPDALRRIIRVDGGTGDGDSWDGLLAKARDTQTPVPTTPESAAIMVYTSGTTGPPKGALHGHRVLHGHLPGVQVSHEGLPQPGDRIWTPADWAWAGGLFNALLPGLYFGVPVLSYRARKFDPEEAFRLMADQGVRNAFIPPTALKLMMGLPPADIPRDLRLRSVGSAGEALGQQAYEWGLATFGLPVNEFYGQTECNYVVSASSGLGVSRPGAMGKPVPGHDVAILDADGQPCEPGQPGQIGIRAPDPVMFLEYWNQPEATRNKYVGNWLMTGDQGQVDEDGYFHFIGRDDDIITSSGYRIGPGEIEDCLIGHPAVRLAAVVGKPDPVRTEIVKAYIALNPGASPAPQTKDEIRRYVKTTLSAHEYPREIEFVDEIPLTTTGKVIRRHFREQAIREAAQTGETAEETAG